MQLYSSSSLDVVAVRVGSVLEERRYPQCGNKSFVCSVSCVGFVIYSLDFFFIPLLFIGCPGTWEKRKEKDSREAIEKEETP